MDKTLKFEDNNTKITPGGVGKDDTLLFGPAGKSYPIITSTDSTVDKNTIVFHVGGEEALKFCPEGEVFIWGRLAENDKEIVDGMRQFLQQSFLGQYEDVAESPWFIGQLRSAFNAGSKSDDFDTWLSDLMGQK